MLVGVEDGEAGSVEAEDGFDELKAEAGKTVAVGHNDLWDSTAHAAFHQKGEPPTTEVDARRDVRDGFVVGVARAEGRDLALEVVFLVGGRDSGVDDAAPGTGPTRRRLDRFGVFVACVDKVVDGVESLCAGFVDARKSAAPCPVAECCVTNPECGARGACGYKAGATIHRFDRWNACETLQATNNLSRFQRTGLERSVSQPFGSEIGNCCVPSGYTVAFQSALANGAVEVCRWLRANGSVWPDAACDWAAASGHLETVQWLRANGCDWTSDACDKAAKNGDETADAAPGSRTIVALVPALNSAPDTVPPEGPASVGPADI